MTERVHQLDWAGDAISLQQHIEILEAASELGGCGIAVYAYDASSGVLGIDYANDVMLSRMRISRQMLQADPELLFRQNETLKRELLMRIQTGVSEPIETLITRPDGSTYIVVANCRRLRQGPDGRARFITISRDVTQERRNDARFRLLAHSVEEEPDAVFIVRMNTVDPLRPKIVYVNRAFCDLTGYEFDDINSGTYPVIIGDDTDIAQVMDSIEQVMDGRNVSNELLLYRRDGSSFWAEYRVHPIDLPERHCVIIVRDITERRAKDMQIELLSGAVDEASDFVIIIDGTPEDEGGARVVYVNDAVARGMGYPREELIGKSYTELYSPENPAQVVDSIRNNIVQGRPNFCEVLFRRKDEAPFWLEFVARPFVHPTHGGKYRILVGRDITLRRRAANQVALLLAGIETSDARTVLYERDNLGHLSMSYENPAAATRGRYRLLELLDGDSAEAKKARSALERGEDYRMFFVERDDASNEIVEFSARPIRNGSGIEAVLTQEHVVIPDLRKA